MKHVRDITVFANIPILVRAALNVPVENGVVTNDYRLRRALPTLQFLTERGARVVVISHLGDAGTETLAPVAEALSKLMPGVVSFCPYTIGEKARAAVRALPSGKVLVLENLRRDRGEVHNDRAFAKELATLADAFVQDSFDTCHRLHASMVGVPEFLPSYAGFLLAEEVQALTNAMKPENPSLAVIGGAKFGTKQPVLDALLAKYDRVFVGGALANDFLAASGQKIGASLVSHAPLEKVKKMLGNPKLVLPVDSIVAPKGGGADVLMRARVAKYGEVGDEDVILDHGPATCELLADLAHKSKTILWNGPLGMYEKGFTHATDALAHALAESSGRAVIGGGDTVAAVERLGILPRMSFVSTGGGAMLDFLAEGTLPGIKALG